MNTRQPNILFFFPDQHRPDWLGCNSALPLRMPNLDWLCSNGVRFTNAFTPYPLCSSARACLATGRNYYRCVWRDNGQNTPLSLPTYYRQLRDARYEVVGVGKFDLHKSDHDWGLDGSKMLAECGFTDGIDNEGKGDAISSYRSNGMSTKGPYMQFLQENGLTATHLAMYEPYLSDPDWLNFPVVTDLPDAAYCDNPFDVTTDMRSQWRNVEFPALIDNDESNPKAILARRQNYAAMLENIDGHVGLMIDIVKQREELNNTIIVYSSDHGEMLGDHGRWAKSVWYTPSSGVPLIISGPGIQSGVCSDALVFLHDLSATFLDYAGAVPLQDADARTIRASLERREKHCEYVISGLNEWGMIFNGRHKCVIGAKSSYILFDTQEDPHELIDIANIYADYHTACRNFRIQKSKARTKYSGQHLIVRLNTINHSIQKREEHNEKTEFSGDRRG